MLFQVINRTDAEKIFGVFRNVAGATITVNYPFVWDVSAADGNRVSKPASATLSCLCGVADETAADSSYFRGQIYGYRASCYVTNDTSQAIAGGNILVPVDAQWYLDYSAASDGKSGLIIAAEAFATAATPAASTKKVFIRCL